jgi:hypothetical protein
MGFASLYPSYVGARCRLGPEGQHEVALKLAAPVAVAVLHEIGPAIPAYVAVPVMFLFRLSQIISGRGLELRWRRQFDRRRDFGLGRVDRNHNDRQSVALPGCTVIGDSLGRRQSRRWTHIRRRMNETDALNDHND